MAPVAVTLQRQLAVAGSGAPETPHEEAFQQRHLVPLQEALLRLQRPSAEDVLHPEAVWKPLKRLRDAMAVQLRCAVVIGRGRTCIKTGSETICRTIYKYLQ